MSTKKQEYVNVNAKFNLNDSDESKAQIARMLRDGIDLNDLSPGVGSLKIKGKKLLELALERIRQDIYQAKSSRSLDRLIENKPTSKSSDVSDLEDKQPQRRGGTRSLDEFANSLNVGK